MTEIIMILNTDSLYLIYRLQVLSELTKVKSYFHLNCVI